MIHIIFKRAPGRSPFLRFAVVWLGLLLGDVLLTGAPALAEESRGKALFHGEIELDAKLAYTQMPLATPASRCVNCHTVGCGTTQAELGSPPELGSARLLQKMVRITGPAVDYDLPSFCKVLREGLNPAYVSLAANMPIFDVGDADCQALWRYLTEETGSCEK